MTFPYTLARKNTKKPKKHEKTRKMTLFDPFLALSTQSPYTLALRGVFLMRQNGQKSGPGQNEK